VLGAARGGSVRGGAITFTSAAVYFPRGNLLSPWQQKSAGRQFIHFV